MKYKKHKLLITVSENKCPKCGQFMERRKHKERPRQNFFYTEWDYCKPCKRVQHYEKYKSLNWQEIENNQNVLAFC